jgi:hypothetical protein
MQNQNTLKMTAAFPLLALASIHADYSSTDTDNNKVTPIVTTSRSAPTEGIILPSSRPQVDEGVDLFITADWLIWQANTSGLGYAVENEVPSATTITKGHVRNPSLNYEFGFKVGLGCNLSHDGWDASLSWTWFRDKANDNTSNDSGQSTLFTTFISPTATSTSDIDSLAIAQSAGSNYHLRFDTLDLEMGREFRAGKWLSLRPFFGLRSAWIDQKYHVEYGNVSTLFAQSTTLYSEYDVHMTNNYWGFGPRLGLNGNWGFGSGWSLYGNAGISLLYGYFHINHKEESTDLSSVEATQKQVNNSFHAGKAATDLEVGLQWDYMFFNDTFHLGVHAGWQQQLFFSQNQFLRFTNSVEQGQFLENQGDLAFQGWSIGMRFDF